jgi:hypothetical protein
VIRVGSIPVVQYDVAPERNCAYRCNQRNPHNAAIYQAYHRCITSSLSLTRPASLSASSARPWWCPGRRYKKALERFAPDYLPTLKPRTHERHRTSFPLRQPACGWITRPIQKSPSLTIGGSWLSAWVSTPLPDRIQNHVYYEQREAGAGGPTRVTTLTGHGRGGQMFTQMGFYERRWVGYPARNGRSADLAAVDSSCCRG